MSHTTEKSKLPDSKNLNPGKQPLTNNYNDLDDSYDQNNKSHDRDNQTKPVIMSSVKRFHAASISLHSKSIEQDTGAKIYSKNVEIRESFVEPLQNDNIIDIKAIDEFPILGDDSKIPKIRLDNRTDSQPFDRRANNYNNRHDGQTYDNRRDGQYYNNRRDGQNYDNRRDGQNYDNRRDGQNYDNRRDGQNYDNRRGGQFFDNRRDRERERDPAETENRSDSQTFGNGNYDRNNRQNNFGGRRDNFNKRNPREGGNRYEKTEQQKAFDDNIMKQEDMSATLKAYSSFDEMSLKEQLLRGIYAFGFEKPSVIQSKAIAQITSGKEIIAQAQSGTGKTGTFVISMLQRIDETLNENQAIILAPTHELASQIKEIIVSLGSFLNINVALCIGKIKIWENKEHLNSSHIVVGTPGRVFDMIERKYLDPTHIKLLIMDEADEMLSRGFKDQVRDIIEKLPTTVQICLFSATITAETLKITKSFMTDPVKILVPREQLSLDGIKQFHISLEEEEHKFDTLCDLYEALTISQSIVYVNTKNKVEWLRQHLEERSFSVSTIHSDMTSTERFVIIREFRKGASRILISTDLLARGIDIQQVSIVINYDVPSNVDNYLHRIGRSGRFGRKGVAINFVTGRDQRKITEIENHYNTSIEEMPADISTFL
jgi:translation initiation factor 4A